jgi:hypothetical protein
MLRGTRGTTRIGALIACTVLFGALAGCGGGDGGASAASTGSTPTSQDPTTPASSSSAPASTPSGTSTADTGFVSLAWQVPTTNTNGSALTNLSGYVINYGQSATALNNAVKIDSPSTVSYVVDNLAAGTWYFAISAVASDGTQSSLSNVVSTTVQ